MSLFATVTPLPVVIEPARWVCIDLETSAAPDDVIAEAVAAWKAPSSWKPETVESKRAEAEARIRDRSALLDQAPIICAAVQTDRERLVLNGMSTSAHTVEEWTTLPCENERGLLATLRVWLDHNTGPDTIIVGHNVSGFDLPKLRGAYLRAGLRLPKILRVDQPPELRPRVFDTMSQFRYFSPEYRDERYVSLEVVARYLGIPKPKTHVVGSDVPRLHADGQHAVICTYCALDTAITARAYLLMTGTAPDLE